jgi:hypothetical protein
LSGGGGATGQYQQIGVGYVAGTSVSPIIMGSELSLKQVNWIIFVRQEI